MKIQFFTLSLILSFFIVAKANAQKNSNANAITVELIIIFNANTSPATITTLRTALNATEIGYTLPSTARLWRCNLTVGSTITVPTISGGTYSVGPITAGNGASQASGVVVGSGSSQGVSTNGIIVIPANEMGEGGQTHDIYSLSSCIPQSTLLCAKGRRSVKIALLDSGLDFTVTNSTTVTATHPLLQDYIHYSNDIPNGIDDDGDGLVDNYVGYDFVENKPIPQDMLGHGTSVAGVVRSYLAYNNTQNIKIVSYKVLDNNGSGREFNFIRAIDQAIKDHVDVANCSFISNDIITSQNQPLAIAIRGAAQGNGMLVSCAAGNTNTNIDQYLFSPAAFTEPNIITTGSYTCNRLGILKSSFSNYGRQNVDLMAPGERVFSTFLGGNFAIQSGTSFCAPATTAIAALLASNQQIFNWQSVKCAILTGAEKANSLANTCLTSGTLNGEKAHNVLLNNGCQVRSEFSVTQANNPNTALMSKSGIAAVSPNPFDRDIQLTLQLQENGPIQTTITDISGRLIQQQTTDGTKGANSIPLSISVEKGIYFVHLQSGTEQQILKIIKQ